LTVPVSALRFEQPSSGSVVPGGEAVVVSARARGESFSQIWYLSRDDAARRITNDLSDYREARLSANAGALVPVQTQTLSNVWTTPKGEPTKPRPVTSGEYTGVGGDGIVCCTGVLTVKV
jgi:hypothetical protein